MIFQSRFPDLGPLRSAIADACRMDEAACVRGLIEEARPAAAEKARTAELARSLVQGVREAQRSAGGLDAFLSEYELSSREGVVLMCLAEALLRIPDAETANRLIQDKLADADWKAHLGRSESVFVNASTWGLMLTGRVVRLGRSETGDVGDVLGRLVARSGEPVIRQAMIQAMRIMGRQFVLGRTIGEALERARKAEKAGYLYSYDMLGEAARTMPDADEYFEAYCRSIDAIGAAAPKNAPLFARPGISIKLSALHPRYEFARREQMQAELAPRLTALARQARECDVSLAVDAEEADRLDLSLDIFAAVAQDPAVAGWEGFGFVVQAYQKRALPVIAWLSDLAQRLGCRIPVRLVKGAYWDAEIKHAQEEGLAGYPVFTRKANTDVSYLACARRLLAEPGRFYCQFATHNAHTLAAVLAMTGPRRDFEFQRLHGMGETLYDQVIGADRMGVACRIYAPVGGHEELLAYLVRRLLENGANTSFVNRIVDEALPIDRIVADPVDEVERLDSIPHPRIPLPEAIYGAERRNSRGVDLCDGRGLAGLALTMEAAALEPWSAAPVVGGVEISGGKVPSLDPADGNRVVGQVTWADGDAGADAGAEAIDRAVTLAVAAQPGWDAEPAERRADCLDRVADLCEEHLADFMALCVRDAGKTVPDAIAEVREAVDFCRYYATRARAEFARPMIMPGPTGEYDEVTLHGRGVFACISPWNFPLAIFMGQVTAALAAGNAVVAKPAEQTPLIAALAVRLMHRAGIPADVLHLLPGDGAGVGGRLVADPGIAGVAFTGSTETARLINRTLASRDGPIAALIAETGGQNVMIVDSTALPEQVVRDVVRSSFQSAGQRCSALRVLFLQEDVAPRIIEMLGGAMAELTVGDPALLATDVGPVIDRDALAMLDAHAGRMDREARLLHAVPVPADLSRGTFFGPRAYEIEGIHVLEREVFGPILHVVRYRARDLDGVCDAINATGYGLTLGVHSRIDATARQIHARVRAGNCYVNRNMIGAVVGVQPFGGEGLSGTGPKAGGPRYLHRFATERSLSIDTTAAGGNAALLSLDDDEG